jgi:TatD DNase family protein
MIDSHCHLADEAFAADLEAVVARAQAAGVSAAMCILSADEDDEVARAATVRQAWPGAVFAAAVHPHRAGAYAGRAADAANAARTAVARTGAVAVGEIGLDYHYDFAPPDVQREVFAAQIALAVELGKPVVIHTREATDDTLAVLREAGGGRVRAVMHCFSGSIDDARRALELGFYISLAGILTFPKAGALREVAAFVPEDRLLIETDAPFLAPVPHRGKRNEPAWVAETLKQLATLRSKATEEIDARVTANFDAFVGRRVDTPAKPMV